MFLRSFAFAAALSVAPLAASAQDWAFDPSHTSVSFKVNHLGFSEITGFFREFEADVSFDPDDIGATEVSFTIAADSVDTLWPARDEHLRNADFLDVETHPEITFVSTAVEPTGDASAVVIGDLTIKGVTQEISLDATLNQIGPNPFNPAQQIAGFTLTGEIDRTDFGVDYGAPAIGAVLPLTINVELIQGS
jgi:polyisoprenoid-binding protein YceI